MIDFFQQIAKMCDDGRTTIIFTKEKESDALCVRFKRDVNGKRYEQRQYISYLTIGEMSHDVSSEWFDHLRYEFNDGITKAIESKKGN